MILHVKIIFGIDSLETKVVVTYANCLDIGFILGHVVQATGNFNFALSKSLLRFGVESAVRRCTGENTKN
jgi:hypothetical protein